MKRFRLVLADNDGTLINDNHELTERTREALEKLHEKGYMFGLASGRTVADLKTFSKNWGLSFDFDMIIGVNGAELWDGFDNKLYQKNFIKPDKIKEIYKRIEPFDYTVQFIRDDKYYFNRLDEFSMASMSRNGQQKARVLAKIDDLWADSVSKILVRLPAEKMPEFEQHFRENPIEGTVSYKTQPFIYEFMMEGTDKTNAMKDFCQIHDIPLEEVISFGDTSNDNGMLRDSYGVCLLNGSDDTKAVSKEITEYDNNHDGFARYVEKYLL